MLCKLKFLHVKYVESAKPSESCALQAEISTCKVSVESAKPSESCALQAESFTESVESATKLSRSVPVSLQPNVSEEQSFLDSQSTIIYDAFSFAEKQSVDNQVVKEQSVVNRQASSKGQSIVYDSETEQSLKDELSEDDLSVAESSDVEDSS